MKLIDDFRQGTFYEMIWPETRVAFELNLTEQMGTTAKHLVENVIEEERIGFKIIWDFFFQRMLDIEIYLYVG